jgi:adenylylsulfate kinase
VRDGGDGVSAAPAPGVVVWFTGLPSSGKSTLARAVAERLRAAGIATLVLDGDEVRAALRPTPAYDDEGRDAFYETLAGLAALAAAQGLCVLVPATAPRAAYRSRARRLCPRFVEVFVDTPADVCAARDDKGLYARARAGDVPWLPGIGVTYDTPRAPEIRISIDTPLGDAADQVAARVLEALPIPSRTHLNAERGPCGAGP